MHELDGAAPVEPRQQPVERRIAQVPHVELLSPKPDETVAFLKNLLGMQETGRWRPG